MLPWRRRPLSLAQSIRPCPPGGGGLLLHARGTLDLQATTLLEITFLAEWVTLMIGGGAGVLARLVFLDADAEFASELSPPTPN